MQTTGKALEVVNREVGAGDLQGKITAIDSNPGQGEPFVEIDGQRFSVLPYTQYWTNDNQTNFQEIRVGDNASVWFPGYQIMDEKPITQIIVKR
jgi:hypothetical protein